MVKLLLTTQKDFDETKLFLYILFIFHANGRQI